jgi:hypothetical protein
LLTVPTRRGPTCLTAVYGPTGMAFDPLACQRLPRAIRPGEGLVWLDAGAYHLPWETRFSHGLTAVVWQENHAFRVARGAEDFASWWKAWKVTMRSPPLNLKAVLSGSSRNQPTSSS